MVPRRVFRKTSAPDCVALASTVVYQLKLMTQKFFGLAGLLLTLSVVIGLTGCSSQPVDQNNPESVFKDAEADVAADRFQMAHEKFGKIRHRFPYSKYAILAQLKIGDVYFKEESYAEAANAYQLFLELHPNHESAPYAAFQMAESYFLDIPSTVARDMTSAQRALQAFDTFLKKYPTDERAKTAKERIATARDLLAEKELYIGNFYHIRNKPIAAKGRFERLKATYPDSKHIPEADEKLKEDEEKISEREASQSGT